MSLGMLLAASLVGVDGARPNPVTIPPPHATCACGAPLPPYAGLGRPRVRCEACSADKAALGKMWREQHADVRRAYNLARRITPQPKACAECARDFTPQRRDALVCSDQCRNARKARRRWEPLGGAGDDRKARYPAHPGPASRTHITDSPLETRGNRHP